MARKNKWKVRRVGRLIKEKRRGPKIQRKAKWEITIEKRAACKSFLINRDGNKCGYCFQTKKLTIDHIIPLSKGGADKIYNMILACRSCNVEKADMNIEDWLKHIKWE